jgi:hypothetical protein
LALAREYRNDLVVVGTRLRATITAVSLDESPVRWPDLALEGLGRRELARHGPTISPQSLVA